MRCPSCQEPLQAGHRFCPACGSGATAGDVSRTVSLHARRAGVAPAGAAGPGESTGGDRLVPGALLAGRYRIVGLLGRGGMGEIYRAEDLRLGETVALKLLPPEKGRDPEARARLREEVKAARRVTHPHVCRVFDLEEVDGLVFLSMEYIDGEDLSSLLRRVHHLPVARAREVAQQISLGLAAIHRQGLLHRDLKPANVMLDGRGNARITDLGLAEVAGGGDGVLAGTPFYMAPEQLAGAAATVQSDLFALGLVLYELFSGERAYPGVPADLAALRRSRSESTPSRLESLDAGIPAELAEAIHRCLEPRPADRPRSVEELLPVLGIGDPVALALAAGETPSPDMLARAGPEGTLTRGRATLLLALALAGVVASLALCEGGSVVGFLAPRLSVEVLDHHADRHLMELAGLAPARYSRTLVTGNEAVPSGEVEEWRDRPFPPLWLERLVAPDPIPLDAGEWPAPIAGAGRVVVDLEGRLRDLSVVLPAPPADSPPDGEPPFEAALAAAGLDAYPRRALDVPWAPPVWAEARRAWMIDHPSGPLRAWLAGSDRRLAYFALRPGSGEPAPAVGGAATGRPDPPAPGAITPPRPIYEMYEGIVRALALLGLAVAGAAAWRNRRRDRADDRGALRFALLVAALSTLTTAAFIGLGAGVTAAFVFDLLGLGMVRGLVAWTFYLALEPAIRRRKPRAAIAWSRLLQGRLADPLVAREALLGLAVGAVTSALGLLEARLRLGWGRPAFFFQFLAGPGLEGSPSSLLAAWGAGGAVVLIAAFVPLLVFVAVRAVLRHERASEVVAFLLGAALLSLATARSLAFGLVLAGATSFLALRVGVVAAFACLMVRPLLLATPYTLDTASFYFVNTPVALVVLGGLAGLAWRSVRETPERPAGSA